MLRSNQPHYVKARREKALARRQKDVIIHDRVLADDAAPEVERAESKHKRAVAITEVQSLKGKLTVV
jgi:hypothetical protein